MQDAVRMEVDSWLQQVADKADIAAFERLFDCYFPRLQRFMQRAGINPQEAEELVQETLLRVWVKAAQYRSALGTPDGWIFAVARNVRNDRLRRQPGRQMPVTVLPDRTCEQPDIAATGVEAVAMLERFCELPQEQVAVLTLAFVEGLSQSEISRRLNLPLGTVKTRMRLGCRSLRRKLQIEL